jgi:small subunit ribosomal protein S7
LFTKLWNLLLNTTRSIEVLEQAIKNAKPLVEVKARRIGGAAIQVPLEVDPERGTVLAMQWLLTAARNRSGRSSVSLIMK